MFDIVLNRLTDLTYLEQNLVEYLASFSYIKTLQAIHITDKVRD